MNASALEAGLDAEQLAAVTTNASPVAVLAPAGSGKTRVLSRRIAHRIMDGSIEPQHVLAVTFTRRAAAQLRDRLSGLGLRDKVTAGTFHALALAQIRDHRRDNRLAPPRVLDRKRQLLEEVTGRHNRASLAEQAIEIEWAKARQIPPAHYAGRAGEANRRTRSSRADLAEGYRRYEVAKQDRNLLDFDDLLLEAARLIERDTGFARAQRWRFRHLFVDEFQDINPLQFRLLEAWRGDNYDLFVVGDPQQAIYTWNGADPNFLLEIRDHYPPVEVIQLKTNYRSSPQILRGAESVFAAAGLTAEPTVPTHADGDLPRVIVHPDEQAEATAIARSIRLTRGPGRGWGSHAVLVRTNAQLTPIREALRSAGIPHEVRGADPVVDHPGVRPILERLDRDNRTVLAAVADLDPASVESDLGDAFEELLERAQQFARSTPGATGAELAAWLRANADRRSDRWRDAVTLATFHAAKGLEWPIVHLAGLEAGYVPISHARSRSAKAEEARLLYVAMTRAERDLHLHAAARRHLGQSVVERSVSPLLASLPTVAPEPDEQVGHSAIETARESLVDRLPGRESLTSAIEAWRDSVAQRARVPAESVLNDHTLRRIAEIRPSDLDELAAIEGLGRIKASRFGDELLDTIRDHSRRPSTIGHIDENGGMVRW